MLLISLHHYYTLRLSCKPAVMCDLMFLFTHPKIHCPSGHSFFCVVQSFVGFLLSVGLWYIFKKIPSSLSVFKPPFKELELWGHPALHNLLLALAEGKMCHFSCISVCQARITEPNERLRVRAGALAWPAESCIMRSRRFRRQSVTDLSL